MISDLDLSNWFSYHPPEGDQAARYAEIRDAGLEFARMIRDRTPASADQTTAIRTVREAVMWANVSIATQL